jgi:hypothetical protein
MKEYKEQNGCWNCLFVFFKSEWDDPSTWYCNIDNNRTICGDSHMGEEFPGLYEEDIDKFSEASDRWNSWAKEHEVQPYGICKSHRLKRKKRNETRCY